MKTYLLIVLSAAALFSGVEGVSAQSDDGEANKSRAADRHGQRGFGRGFGDPARMIERMSRHLDLDETQQQNIRNIIDAARPEFDELRERARTNRKAMRDLDTSNPDYSALLNNLAIENGELVAEGTMLFGRVRSEVDAELTEAQRAELSEAMQRNRGGFRRGRRHAGSDDGTQ